MLDGISYFTAEISRLEAENSHFMAEKSHLMAEISRLTAENSLVTSKNKVVQTMNDLLRIKQGRDAEKISDLENEIAAVQPSAKNISDTEKIHGLKMELDAMFQAYEASNNLLDIAKKNLLESEKKNKELEERNKNLEKYLGYHTDFENSKKKLIGMQLKVQTDFQNFKEKIEMELKHHTDSGNVKKMESSTKELIQWHIKRLENVSKTGEKNLKKLSEHGDLEFWLKKREAEALKRLLMLDPAVD
jgi:uncharacterized protein (DUF3084 family)